MNEFHAWEEWKRRHRVEWFLRRVDVLAEEAMVAVGARLLRRFPWLRRLV